MEKRPQGDFAISGIVPSAQALEPPGQSDRTGQGAKSSRQNVRIAELDWNASARQNDPEAGGGCFFQIQLSCSEEPEGVVVDRRRGSTWLHKDNFKLYGGATRFVLEVSQLLDVALQESRVVALLHP